MVWDLKTKNAEATTALKTKIPEQEPDYEIFTPDLNQILVGSGGDEVLIWSPAYNNWDLPTKNSAPSYTLKSKIL